MADVWSPATVGETEAQSEWRVVCNDAVWGFEPLYLKSWPAVSPTLSQMPPSSRLQCHPTFCLKCLPLPVHTQKPVSHATGEVGGGEVTWPRPGRSAVAKLGAEP